MHGTTDRLRTTLLPPPGNANAGCVGSMPVSMTAMEVPRPSTGRPARSRSSSRVCDARVATVPLAPCSAGGVAPADAPADVAAQARTARVATAARITPPHLEVRNPLTGVSCRFMVISATEVATAPRRRTQAERRAGSRQRLLDAAIACLAEGGYAR